jgi:hypothetical protein
MGWFDGTLWADKGGLYVSADIVAMVLSVLEIDCLRGIYWKDHVVSAYRWLASLSTREPNHVYTTVKLSFYGSRDLTYVYDLSANSHDFYESDDRVTLSVYIKNANPEEVKVTFTARSVSYRFVTRCR